MNCFHICLKKGDIVRDEEYEGRNKTVEEYFKRIMLFGKTLKGQS